MSGKILGSGEGLTADFTGMTKSQLYDIMSQMKTLIEQNKQQARGILIQNPSLTKALFQAQIMLGMVQPPQVIPNIPPTPPQPSVPSNPQPIVPLARNFPDQVGSSQTQPSTRKQNQIQSLAPISTAASLNIQPQPIPSSLLPKPHQNFPSPPVIMSQSTLPSLPPNHQSSGQLPNLHQLQGSSISTSHLPSRPAPPNLHQPYGALQPSYHNQQPIPHPSPIQPHFLSGSGNMGPDFSTIERNSSRIPISSDNLGQSSLGSGIHTNQPAQASLSPEMEQNLLQQVMSLTPELISNLPPEQRHQVLQLQQMLRQKKLV